MAPPKMKRSEVSMKNIVRLVCNSSELEKEVYYEYNVGQAGVKRIIEHRAQGEGDRWFYDIELENGEVIREFRPITVSGVWDEHEKAMVERRKDK